MSEERFIKEVKELLEQIREEQIKMGENIEKYHKINMKKFAKLREYNEICDMTNQVFERRISNIENILKKAIQ